jgi:hypothetical protein
MDQGLGIKIDESLHDSDYLKATVHFPEQHSYLSCSKYSSTMAKELSAK